MTRKFAQTQVHGTDGAVHLKLHRAQTDIFSEEFAGTGVCGYDSRTTYCWHVTTLGDNAGRCRWADKSLLRKPGDIKHYLEAREPLDGAGAIAEQPATHKAAVVAVN